MPPPPTFPPQVEEVFAHVQDDAVWLHAAWKIYLGLFAGEGKLAPLNETAPAAFAVIEFALRDSMLLALGRLNDPAVSRVGGEERKNYSLDRLIEDLKGSWTADELREATELRRELKQETEVLQRYRNRWRAHKDGATASGAETLPTPTYKDVKRALEAVSGFVNHIHKRFGGETDFSCKALFGDGEDVVAALKFARDWRERERLTGFVTYPK
jgi:hypothetical protein